LKIAELTLVRKPPTIPLPGQRIRIKKKIQIYNVYFSINSPNFHETIFTNLNPSSGGIGRRLKIARAILIKENIIQNEK